MSKNICILYFSPTGNCKKLADVIASALNSHTVTKIDITPFKNRLHNIDFSKYDFVFLLFPIYAGRIPDPLNDFILKHTVKNLSASTIAVWGNVLSLNALRNSKILLEKQGFNVVSGAEIVAEHSYNMGKIKLGINRPNKDEIIKIKEFAQASISTENNDPVFSKPKLSIIYALPQKTMPNIAVKLCFDKDLCTECKICRNLCPVNAIDENFEIDNKKCIKCLSCVSNCKFSARTKKYRSFIAPTWLSLFQHKSKPNKFYI